jgi:hypothetical protein
MKRLGTVSAGYLFIYVNELILVDVCSGWFCFVYVLNMEGGDCDDEKMVPVLDICNENVLDISYSDIGYEVSGVDAS